MSKVAATKEGAQELRNFGQGLRWVIQDMQTCCSTLISQISGLNGLGDFEGDILDLTRETTQVIENGRDSVEELAGRLERLADEIEVIASYL